MIHLSERLVMRSDQQVEKVRAEAEIEVVTVTVYTYVCERARY